MTLDAAAAERVVVLHGDQTGEELLIDALRFLDPELIPVNLELEHFDLSLGRRRESENRVVYDAADALLAAGWGLKAATITPETKGDVGSPECDPSLPDRRAGDRQDRPSHSLCPPCGRRLLPHLRHPDGCR